MSFWEARPRRLRLSVVVSSVPRVVMTNDVLYEFRHSRIAVHLGYSVEPGDSASFWSRSFDRIGLFFWDEWRFIC